MATENPRLSVPSDKKVKANVVAWLRYFVDVSSQKKVAEHMGMSPAHISNVYNHPELHGPGISFLLRMHFGLDISMRELVYDDPPKITPRPQPPALPQPTNVGGASKRA